MTSTPIVSMNVEVMGCPTICQHCWAMGRNYQAMPLPDVTWIVHEVRRFCIAHGLVYEGYPMHEVAAHPEGAQILRLFHEIWQIEFQPLTTTGVPLVLRSDWREFLEALREVGASVLWLAFHGAEEVHDRAVMRKGAYRESLQAIKMIHEARMEAGCNLFLTKENIGQFDNTIADLHHAGMDEIIPQVYGFTANARGRHTEPLRLEWRDVEQIAEKLDAIPEACLWRRFWHELPQKHTESWYIEQALAGTWPDDGSWRREQFTLICRPNLDVYLGEHGQFLKLYGNLRYDGVDEVLGRAVADGVSSYEDIWFPGEPVLPIQELAARFGNAESQRIHPDALSIRDWWMDRARRARHIK